MRCARTSCWAWQNGSGRSIEVEAGSDRVIGGFRILQSIRCGTGSQGTIYKAVCVDSSIVPSGTVVALKVMPSHEEGDAQLRRMEARTASLARIEHPNIVRYFGCFAEHDSFADLHVIVQEFLEGETLKERLSRFPFGLDVDECMHIARSVISALDHASAHGIVHRDVKPANIFICSDGTVKLIDFEIAQAPEGTAVSSGDNLKGSFDYMAPEFATMTFRGDAQSDVFSAGVVLHEMLTGKRPYGSDSGKSGANFDFLARWASKDVSQIKIASKIRYILGGAVAVLSRALSPERDRRYGGFQEFLSDLATLRMKSIRNRGHTYQLLQFIGKGGFGEVFKARVRESGRYVAVKHLLKAEYAKRFEREAKIMARLDSPCFVRLVDFFYAAGTEGREAFLVMDFLDGMPGSSLRDAIREAGGKGLPPEEALRAFSMYARGLSIMHARGIFHRDIKPSNLYYPKGRPESAAIMDLGIARDVNGTMTTGQVPGTLDYMPPEVVVSGSRGEGGMDIYALGLCLYEALTGRMAYPRLPTGSAAYVAFFNRARARSPPDLEEARRIFGDEMFSLLKEMTEPEVQRRLKSADALALRLDRMIEAKGGALSHRSVLPPRPIPPPTRPVAPPLPTPSRSSQPRRATVSPQVSEARPMMRSVSVSKPPPMRSLPHTSRNLRIPPVVVHVALAIIVVVVLGVVLWTVFGNALRVKLATYELNGVIDAWRQENVAAAEGREAGWFSRWSAVGSGWRRISRHDFGILTNRLGVAKAEIRREKASRELEMARRAERRVCMTRISACRRRDGSLDEDQYLSLDGWTLPEWLNGDREVEIRLSGLDRSLVAAIKAKLRLEPVSTRLARIRTATALLNNSWTARLLPPADRAKVKMAIETVSKWCVVTIRNACSDVIAVDGTDIAIGGSRVMLFKDGRSDGRTVVRDGYQPMRLPGDLNDKVFEIGDGMMEAMPVRVELPFFEKDVSCRIDDRPCTSKETIELKPGLHECLYSKRDYALQRIPFTVHVKVETVVPEPGPWKRTDEYLARRKSIDEGRQQFLSAPVAVSVPRLDSDVICLLDGERQGWGTVDLKPGTHRYRYEREGFEPQAGTFQLKPGEPIRLSEPKTWETVDAAAERKRVESLKSLQDSVRAKCRELLANEPVQDRQDRLEAAGISVTRAIYDGVLTETEAKPLLDEINRRKRWAVGMVENECRMPIVVGGRPVAAGTKQLLVFENGIPDEWIAAAKGFEKKSLLRDFDGCVLTFDESDFVPLDVEVRVPILEDSVTCQFEGTSISGVIRLKPGSYLCIYRKRGYEDQMVRFQVRSGQPTEIPPPSIWRARIQ